MAIADPVPGPLISAYGCQFGGGAGGTNINSATKVYAVALRPYEKQSIKTVTFWANVVGTMGATDAELRIHPPKTTPIEDPPWPDTATTLSGPHTFQVTDDGVGVTTVTLSSAYTYDPTAYPVIYLAFKNLNGTPASNYYAVRVANTSQIGSPAWMKCVARHWQPCYYDGSTWNHTNNAFAAVMIEDDSGRLIAGGPPDNGTDTTNDIYGTRAYWNTVYVPPIAGLTQWITGLTVSADQTGEDVSEVALFAGLPNAGVAIPNATGTRTYGTGLNDEPLAFRLTNPVPWRGGVLSAKFTAATGGSATDAYNYQVCYSTANYEQRERLGVFGRAAVQRVNPDGTVRWTPFSCYYNGSTYSYSHVWVPMALLGYSTVNAVGGLTGGPPRTRSQAAWRR